MKDTKKLSGPFLNEPDPISKLTVIITTSFSFKVFRSVKLYVAPFIRTLIRIIYPWLL